MVPFSDLGEGLHAIGGKLTVLHSDSSYPGGNVEMSNPWIRALATNGAVLRKLHISFPWNVPLEEHILSAVPGRVQCLVIRGKRTQLITANCIGLQELDLLELAVDAEDMWRAVGPTLESLSIGRVAASIYPKTMGDIQTFCLKLTSVEIDFLEGHWEELAALYMSYGDQLKLALFSTERGVFPLAKIQEILSVCPNVSCGALTGLADVRSQRLTLYWKT